MKHFKLFSIILFFNVQLAAQINPEVISVTPLPQSMDFLPTLEISIDFNRAVDITSFNDTTFQVWGRWSGVHRGTFFTFND